MEMKESLFNSGQSCHPGNLILNDSVLRDSEAEVSVSLFQRCLVEVSEQGRRIIPYDFDVKYSFTSFPPQMQLERGLEKVTYDLKSEQELANWRNVLKGRLNQRGFHEQFKPKKKIGKGNFASVYLAEKVEDGRSYAVKAFSKEAAYAEENGKECIIKEIEILRSLDHRCCMRLFEVFETQNSLYVVVQLLSGGQLYDKVKAKYRFKPAETRATMHSILQGLKEMHSKRMMHRDLKPQNLIFRDEKNWECVIADFGLAQFADEEKYLFTRCGTPGYVAPEVINIRNLATKYDPICDIFSLGLIFHILLLGVSAFPGRTYNEVLQQNRESKISFEGEQYKRLEPDALALMARMLTKSPTERISAAEALCHPYFSELEEQDIREEEVDVVDVVPSHSKEYPSCESPLLGSANPARRLDRTLKKDSCIDFKMGKENVLTGKVDTIVETGSNPNNSAAKRFESITAPKASKFCKK